MCFDIFYRKLEIEVKGPTENELRIAPYSAVTKGCMRKPRVFSGGDHKYIRARSFHYSLFVHWDIIATIHDRDGRKLHSYGLGTSLLYYKRIVFDLEAPFNTHLVPVTNAWEDLSRFFKFGAPRKSKIKIPKLDANIPSKILPSEQTRENDAHWIEMDSYKFGMNESCLYGTNNSSHHILGDCTVGCGITENEKSSPNRVKAGIDIAIAKELVKLEALLDAKIEARLKELDKRAKEDRRQIEIEKEEWETHRRAQQQKWMDKGAQLWDKKLERRNSHTTPSGKPSGLYESSQDLHRPQVPSSQNHRLNKGKSEYASQKKLKSNSLHQVDHVKWS